MEKLLEASIRFQVLTDEEEYILGCQFPWAQIDRGFMELMRTNAPFKSRNEHQTGNETRKPTKSLHFNTINEKFKISSADSTLRKLKEQLVLYSGTFSKYQKKIQKNLFTDVCNIQKSPSLLPTTPNHRAGDPILELPVQNPIDSLKLPTFQKNSLYSLNGMKEKKKRNLSQKYRQIQLKKNSIELEILKEIPKASPFRAMENRLRPGLRLIDVRKRRSWTEQIRKKVISKTKEKSNVRIEVEMVKKSSKQMGRKEECRKKKVAFPIIGQTMTIQGRSHSESKENKLSPSQGSKLFKTAARGSLLKLKNERKYLKIGEIGEMNYGKRAYQPQFDLISGRGLYCLEKQQVLL